MLKYYNIEINIMQEVPEAVRAALEELKSKHRHHLQLRKCEGGYYVSEATSKWDPEKGRNRAISIYVGKITDSGEFIGPVRKRSSTRGIDNLDQYMKIGKERSKAKEKQQFESEYEPLILKELSTNPRDGIAAISKRIGLPYSTTQYWIKKLEKKYGIHYTIEHWFLRNLGFDRYIAIAKFKDKRPNASELKKEVEKNPYIQLAVLTRGAYDLFLFMVAPDIRFAEDTVYDLRSSPVFENCPGTWYSSYYQQGIGYIMLRDSFFDILKNKIWQRTKETPRKQKDQLFLREYATLKELNNNGLIEFSKIDEKYNLKEGSAQYTYHKLIAEDMMKRITIAMDKPPIKDTAIIIAEQLDVNKFNAHKKDYYIETLSDSNTPLNKYIFAGDIGSPYGIILITTTYSDGEIEKIEESLIRSMRGCTLRTSIVSSILTGNLGFRKIDTSKTWIYEKLLKEYNKQ
jgi:DNA-binding Lrp family transcriptional regulator